MCRQCNVSLHVCLSLPNPARYMLHSVLVASARPPAVITHFCSYELIINSFVTSWSFFLFICFQNMPYRVRLSLTLHIVSVIVVSEFRIVCLLWNSFCPFHFSYQFHWSTLGFLANTLSLLASPFTNNSWLLSPCIRFYCLLSPFTKTLPQCLVR